MIFFLKICIYLNTLKKYNVKYILAIHSIHANNALNNNPEV